MKHARHGRGARTGVGHDPAAVKTRPFKRDEVTRELRARVDEAIEQAAIPLPPRPRHW